MSRQSYVALQQREKLMLTRFMNAVPGVTVGLFYVTGIIVGM